MHAETDEHDDRAVERWRDVYRLIRSWECTEQGTTWAFVTGEPGIGKTWLLREAVAAANSRGLMVIRGCGSEFERHVPFGLFVHALDDYLDGLEHEQLRALGGSRLGDLARVFPALSGFGDNAPSSLQDATYRAHRAIRALLERFAEPRGLVLVLDDLQWADQESAALLAHILERPPRRRLTILGAWRSGSGTDVLAGLPLRPMLPGTMIRLGPIGAADAAAMLADVPGSWRRAELLRLSGGNPFYLSALSADPGSVGRSVDVDGQVPEVIAEAVQRDMATLSAAARDLLAAGAVLGDPFDLAVAHVVAGAEEDTLPAAVDELAMAGFIRETAAPRLFAFQRPVVRRAVYQLTPPGRRISGHRRAAAALIDAAAAARGVHLARSATASDPDVASLLLRAGHELVGERPAEAASVFLAAAELTREESAAHAEALQGHGDATLRSGRLRDSRASYERLFQLRSGLAASSLEAVAGLAIAEQLTGHADLSAARLRAALAEAGSAPDSTTAWLFVLAAAASAQERDNGQLHYLAGEALRRTDSAGDPAAHVAALCLAGVAEVGRGHVDAARRMRQLAWSAAPAVAEASHSPGTSERNLAGHPHTGRALSYLALGYLELLLENYQEIAAVLDLLPPSTPGTAWAWWSAPTELLRARACFAQGRLQEAAAAARSAVETARAGGARPLLAHGLATCAAIGVAAGDTEGAADAAREAVRAVAGGGALAAAVEQACGAVRLDLGEQAANLETVGRLYVRAALMSPADDCAWRYRLVLAALDDDRLDEAAAAVSAAEKVAETAGLAMATAFAARSRAAVQMARGQFADAADSAVQAAETAARTGCTIEAARSRLVEASALTLAGHRDRSAMALRVAIEEFRSCGALRYEKEAERQLRRLGRRTPTARATVSDDAPLPLSEREWQVAELVAAGRTNRQIAVQLLLSDKTIETHLTRIFARLGISSRTLLARMVERERARSSFYRRAAS